MCSIPYALRGVIFAPTDQCFATATLFETLRLKHRSFQTPFGFRARSLRGASRLLNALAEALRRVRDTIYLAITPSRFFSTR
jgi:hypothetical protein